MIYAQLPYDSRLGNWMFQYAAARKLSNDVALYTEDDTVARLFEKYPGFFHDVPLLRSIPDGVPVFAQASFSYEPIPMPKPGGDLHLTGYFQSEKYFDRDVVRSFFAPTPEMVKLLHDKYGDWLSRPNVTGISVRRTDYMRLAYNLPFCGKKYYRDCLARIPESKDFIVCSDDYAWCKEYFPKAFPDKHFFFMEGQPVLEQLYVHAFCQNVIMSNSTFSWWGGWLNERPDKRVFMPSLWLGFINKGVDWSSIYFEGAEVIKNEYSVGLYIRAHASLWWLKIRRKTRWAHPIKQFLRDLIKN